MIVNRIFTHALRKAVIYYIIVRFEAYLSHFVRYGEYRLRVRRLLCARRSPKQSEKAQAGAAFLPCGKEKRRPKPAWAGTSFTVCFCHFSGVSYSLMHFRRTASDSVRCIAAVIAHEIG